MKNASRFIGLAALALFVGVLFAPFGSSADLTITAASVAYVSGSQPIVANAGATVTAGQPVYYDSSTGTYKLCNAKTAGTYPPNGVALSGASSGGFFLLAKPGTVIAIGATVTKNTFYYVSGANSGGIAPLADITTGWETVTVGIATSSANVLLICQDCGIAN